MLNKLFYTRYLYYIHMFTIKELKIDFCDLIQYAVYFLAVLMAL